MQLSSVHCTQASAAGSPPTTFFSLTPSLADRALFASLIASANEDNPGLAGLMEWNDAALAATLAAAAGLGASAPQPPFALPTTVHAFKSELLTYFAGEANDSTVIGEGGVLGVVCRGWPSWAQFCVAVSRLCNSAWAVAVVAALAAGDAGAVAPGPLATVYVICEGAAGLHGRVERAFGSHPPGTLFH